MLTAIISITSIAQVILSLFVFSRGRNNLSSRIFFFIGIASLGWALSNYLTITFLDSGHLIYVVRFILFFVVLQNTFFYIFARIFPDRPWKYKNKGWRVYLLFSMVAAGATLSPFVFTSVTVEDGLAITKAGPGIMLFIAHALVSIILAFRALIKKKNAATGSQRSQLQLLLFASLLNWVVVPITNFAVTPLLKTTIFIQLGPLYTLAFASIIAYAIVAQRLFDIKAAVARSLGYIISLAVLAALFGSLVFGVARLVFHLEFPISVQIYISIATAIAALGFQSMKAYFDRLTSRLFYHEDYDLQEVIDKLGSIAVLEISLPKVLSRTQTVLSDALKTSFVAFMLFEDDQPRLETTNSSLRSTDVNELAHHLKTQRKEVLLTDELRLNHPAHSWLRRENIGLSLQLKTQHQVVGYVLFGDKLSGDTFNGRDKQLLSIVANELAIALQNALRFEEISAFNQTLQEKVIEATKELRRTNDKLQALDETKDDFISMASHQLRTPLTSVKGYLSMVLEGDAGKLTATERRMLTQAFISSQRMVYLISDLLNISRLKTGKFVIERTPVNLADMISDEIAQLKETAATRDLVLEYSKPKNFPELAMDETKTRQVVMNFIDNAIYYTPAGGHIRIELSELPATIELRVIDDGIGVPKSEQHHLFTKFYRAGNARKARPDGTGLGLFMARKVIVAQGGATIFSSTENKGSTFGFSFPKTPSTTV